MVGAILVAVEVWNLFLAPSRMEQDATKANGEKLSTLTNARDEALGRIQTLEVEREAPGGITVRGFFMRLVLVAHTGFEPVISALRVRCGP